jgi:hypothetical protein
MLADGAVPFYEANTCVCQDVGEDTLRLLVVRATCQTVYGPQLTWLLVEGGGTVDHFIIQFVHSFIIRNRNRHIPILNIEGLMCRLFSSPTDTAYQC